jgi:hypothetical protein
MQLAGLRLVLGVRGLFNLDRRLLRLCELYWNVVVMLGVVYRHWRQLLSRLVLGATTDRVPDLKRV